MWNLSKSARRFRAADALVVSVPKCGRTWVRAFLVAYGSARAGLEPTWDEERLAAAGAPRVAFTHDRWEQRATPHRWRRWRGADLIPTDRRRAGRIALLVRDPRDLMVSLFFQLTRRERWHRGDFASMLRHPRFGVQAAVGAMNEWLAEWGAREDFALLRYEDLGADDGQAFRELLAFLGQAPVDEEAFAQARRFTAFENMRRLEHAGAFEHGTLRPGDPADPDSYKMRRGAVGAWGEHLRGADLALVEEAMTRLDPRCGYGA